MKKKKGFTLVELLAVIVILAIILVIAVPQIMDTIDSARDASLESSAKMVAAQVENQHTVSQTLGTNFASSGDCTTAKWAGLNDKDYESCTYNIDSNGKASVTLVGKGKFEGKSICDGTRTSAKVTEDECVVPTDESCFAFDEGAITGYDINCGTDVVIPKSINGVAVTSIGINAFTTCGAELESLSNYKNVFPSKLGNISYTSNLIPISKICEGIGITSVIIPEGVSSIDFYAFSGNLIEHLTIPSSVNSIEEHAFDGNPLVYVDLKNSSAYIGASAFGCQDDIATHNLPSTYNHCR